MKNKILLQTFIFLSTAFLLWSCYTNPRSSITRQNVAPQYYSEEKVLRPKYVLYNVTDSLTRLYFSINSNDLLYKSNSYDVGFTARILLSYVVHPVDCPKMIADSGHVVMSDVGTPGQSKLLAASTDMDILLPGKYYLEVTFRDLNKMSISYELLYLDHRGKNVRNNFLFTLDSSETPLFNNYVELNERFRIHYNNPLVAKFFVRYYKNKTGPAPPPFSLEKYNPTFSPDSSWWMNIAPDHSISFKNEGWYTFNTDTISKDGAMIARLHEAYPKIIIQRQLLYPLRYLTMREEYYAMDTAKNTKKAVDQFWLDCSGSQERAREVIRYFYNRVEAANKLFATEKEGWKTDRGMIYLIFGPPANVYRNVDSESWIYGSGVGAGGLTFNFTHKENAFTDQEFVLEHNPEYKVNWMTAVDSWRQGHIYTFN